MDGWAFAQDSLPSGGVLRAVGHAAAGRPFARALGPGEAVRVLTGALMPEGADTVAMEEDCALLGGGTSEAAAEAARAGAEVELRVPEGLGPGANRRRAGEDLQAGAEVLKAGRLLRAADIGLLAAAGRSSVLVRPRLAVALFSCGAELREPGAVGGGEGEGAAGLARERIWDANRPMLRALLAELPVDLQDGGILPDDDRAIEAALARAAEANGLILASGGMSASEEDRLRRTVERLGGLIFQRLAVKPGRPAALGFIGGAEGREGVPFAGLPGNPVAAFVIFHLLARPLILRLAGAEISEPPPLLVRAGFRARKKRGRREFPRVRLEAGPDGHPRALRFPRQGAGVVSSLSWADGLLDSR